MEQATILIVDDDPDVLVAARLLLKRHFSRILCSDDPQHIPSLMAAEKPDVILLDMNYVQDATSGVEGFFWLAKIIELDPLATVILITAYGDVQTAVAAMRNGATDFILKPWENERLVATTSTGLQLRRTKHLAKQSLIRQKQLSADLDSGYHNMIGNCPAMQEVFTTIDKVAKTDVNVLIIGENGTGKELVARGLHRASRRAGEVFLSVDMGAIAEHLFESELFGHEKGAFTDAREQRCGRFEVASGGTLFLDEIGNLNLQLQAKLLRVLEEKQLVRVGANHPLAIDIRLISATNCPIYEQVAKERFRQDLLYRINTVEIHLPPLRERAGDIDLLCNHFLRIFTAKYNRGTVHLSDRARKKMTLYNWPGNIRELQHTIERALILNEGQLLSEEDIFLPTTTNQLVQPNNNLQQIEKGVITAVLKKHRGNISQSAEELGITRGALYRRMSKYDL